MARRCISSESLPQFFNPYGKGIMKPSSNNSSLATAKAPYTPATRLVEVPIVLYEILDLATRGKAAEIVPLIQSVIDVTQSEPGSLARLPRAEVAS